MNTRGADVGREFFEFLFVDLAAWVGFGGLNFGQRNVENLLRLRYGLRSQWLSFLPLSGCWWEVINCSLRANLPRALLGARRPLVPDNVAIHCQSAST